MEFRILGPLEARENGVQLGLGGEKQRALLAVLLLHANETVSTSSLIEWLWERPPARAAKAVQVYVSRLRKVLGGAPTSRPTGYRLDVEPERLDLARFQRLLAEAKDDPVGATDVLREALALWRGPALAEFANEPFARVERLRLEELRIEALEERIEADLALGRHASLLSELEALVAAEPLRDRPRGQLMLALYRCGRQAEALAVYRDGRRALVEQLGIEPIRVLQELEQAILRHDPTLDQSSAMSPLPASATAYDPTPTRALPDAAARLAACPNCGKELPGEFPFCPFCAAALSVTQPRLLEERKVVSVLFCDLVGFTAQSEHADPEDVRARVRPYQQRLRQEIERYGGTVEKFVGDAVMAVFGAPAAHEDDGERAVRAGLRILEAIRELNEADPGLELQVRVGINTGEAVVTVGARVEHGEGIVTGDVVNTAARIQAVAPIDGVAVSESTYQATKRVFEYESLDRVAVKGKSAPIALWRARVARAGLRSDVARFTTPFVGRELEKPLLIGIFERSAQQLSVQLVTVVGEPGVGKSRLVAELSVYADERPEIIRWREGRCLPYGEGITFWALGEIVKTEAGILETDPPDVAALKLEDTVSSVEADRQWLLQRLRPLVGVEAGSLAERHELFSAWRRFFEMLAGARPTVLVFEDLHWADEALLAFVEHLVEWSVGVPLLVLCTARPELYERRPGWSSGLRNAHTINLPPLSDEETTVLVSHLIPPTSLNPQLEATIVERAEGNPLYAEEFARLVQDRGSAHDPGLAQDQGALPDSIQALIAARLDTLPTERKSLLQDAAVLGKVFWAGGVAEIGKRDPEHVEFELHELARKELVRPSRASSLEGEREYAFWHLLVRDVAYAQIPRTERARRHRSAAAWIERKASDRVEDLAEVLAFHYLRALELSEAARDSAQTAELTQPARHFLALAGGRALGLDTAQAEAQLARALTLTSADDPERPLLLARWAEAAYQIGHLSEAAAALDEVLDSLRARARPETTAHALQLRSRLAQRLGESTHVSLAAEAVTLLQGEGGGQTLVDAYAQLASAHHLAGAYLDAIAAADRACSLAQTLGLPDPARALGYRAFSRAYLGDEDGLAEMEHALSLLVESGAGQDAAVLQNNLAIARYPLQGPARSLEAFEQGIAFCEERGLAAAAAFIGANCPALLTELGRPDEAAERATALSAALPAMANAQDLCEVRASELALRVSRGGQGTPEEIEQLVTTARTINQREISGLALTVAAEALATNAPEQACRLLAELEQLPGLRESPYYARQLPGAVRTALIAGDPELAQRLLTRLEPRYPLEEHASCAARAQLAEHTGEHTTAASLYAEAADRWQQFGNAPEHAYALLGHGRCLHALGDPAAQQPLLQARELFAAMGYQPALAETQALLDQRELAASQPVWVESRLSVRDTADHAPP